MFSLFYAIYCICRRRAWLSTFSTCTIHFAPCFSRLCFVRGSSKRSFLNCRSLWKKSLLRISTFENIRFWKYLLLKISACENIHCTLVKGLPGFDLHQSRLCCQRELLTKLRGSGAQWRRELWITWIDLISLISAFTARGDWPGAQWLINRRRETWISSIDLVLISTGANLEEKLDGQLCEWSPP